MSSESDISSPGDDEIIVIITDHKRYSVFYDFNSDDI